jgi:epoxyqueuosine reductase
MDAARVKQISREYGFDLCGIAPAVELPDFRIYSGWVESGFAGNMTYLTDRRAEVRRTPVNLLDGARSVIVVGKVYDTPNPYSTQFSEEGRAWISRYAWGDDYHDVLRSGLEQMMERMHACADFRFKICVDTAPLLERSYARRAGLGWIGRNTCLINQNKGSWLFLGEAVVTLDLEHDSPPPDRCGTCRRCIEACPTAAIVPAGGRWTIDSRLCISYITIEDRGLAPRSLRPGIGTHIFGCDICQDVCPWNRRRTFGDSFEPRIVAPDLEMMAAISEQDFRDMFRLSPVTRARYEGFLRNVAIAMGNAGLPRFQAPLERLAQSEWRQIAEASEWALEQLKSRMK